MYRFQDLSEEYPKEYPEEILSKELWDHVILTIEIFEEFIDAIKKSAQRNKGVPVDSIAFLNKCCGRLLLLQRQWINDPKKSSDSVIALMGIFKTLLESSVYKHVRFVLVFKMIASIHHRYNNPNAIVDLITPYVRENIAKKQDLENAVECIRFVY